MKVDFYHYNFHEIIQWENIWKACLRRGIDAQLVIEPPSISSYQITQLMFDSIVDYCEENHYPYIHKGRYDEADAAVITQAFEKIDRYKGLKLNCHYGVGVTKDVWNIHYKSMHGFDGILLHGEYDKNRIIQNGITADKLWVMGYPKFIPLHTDTIDKTSLLSEFKIDINKKTIVYLPSHHVNSSIDTYLDALAALKNDYNLIIKPHHHNLDHEFSRLNNLKSTGAIVIDYPCSTVKVLAIADLAICDMRSGSYTESILANVPTIGLFIANNNLLDEPEPIAFLLAPICCEPSKLPELVHATINEYPRYNSMLQNFATPYLFSCLLGHDDDRAVDGIIHFVNTANNKSYSSSTDHAKSGEHAEPQFYNSEFCLDLIDIIKKDGGHNILEIGTTTDGIRTKAMIEGIYQNPCDSPKLFCIESSRDKHATFCNEFNKYDFVKTYNALPVDLNHYPSIEDILLFYNTVKDAGENHDFDAIRAAYDSEIENIYTHIMPNGINYIKEQHNIEFFDIALIGRSGFTGTAELETVYGALYLVLDDIRTYKNYFNYKRLKYDKYYRLYKESIKSKDSYAIFKWSMLSA